MCFPVYWMVSTAFKTGPDILTFTPTWFPFPATLDNFQDAIARPFFWRSVLNSVIVVAVVVTLSIVLAFLAALALAKFRFYGRRGVVVTIIGVQMVPLTALIIPLYILISTVDKAPLKVNTLGGLIVTYLTFVLPFAVWTLRGFLMGIPRELEEAAMVDGSSRFGAFVRILLPLVAPGFVATSIFAFVQVWNEFIMAYVLLRDPEKQTLAVWLAGFSTQRGTDFGGLMAGATLTALPVVVFFMLLHRRIAFGLTAGAVRG
jgi:N,N'-diacetylchitobiose transport system permease protein